jgi:tetratricopeptide (TPR) repeat protein
LIKNNKKLLQLNKDVKNLNDMLKKCIDKTKSFTSKKNYEVSILKGIYSYLDKNKNAIKGYLADATALKIDDSKTALLKLLYLKLINDEKYMMIMDELTTKFANSVPLNFINAFELLEQEKYGEARIVFKAIKGLSSNNAMATEYIDLLTDLIKNEKLLVMPQQEEKAENKDSKENEKNIKSEKDTKSDKPVVPVKKEESVKKKVVKKMSSEKASEIGWNLIDKNRYGAAIKKFKYAISVNPNQADAYEGLGEAYRKIGDNENALKYYKIFLRKAPNDSEASYVREQIKKLSK